jgi:hypothetical protein
MSQRTNRPSLIELANDTSRDFSVKVCVGKTKRQVFFADFPGDDGVERRMLR